MDMTVSCERNEALFEQRPLSSHLQDTLSRQSSQAITFIWMASAVVPPLLEKKKKGCQVVMIKGVQHAADRELI